MPHTNITYYINSKSKFIILLRFLPSLVFRQHLEPPSQRECALKGCLCWVLKELLCPATHCSWRGSVAFRANWVTPHSGITSEQRHTGIGLSLSASSRFSVSKAMGLWQPGSTRCLVKWCMRPNNICRVCVWVYMCVSMYVWRQDPRKSKPKGGWGLWGDLACVQRKLQFKQNTECWHSSYWNIQWCAVK